MKKQNTVKEKSFSFASRIVKCYQYLQNDKKEFVLSRQLLKSGTSTGANVRESGQAQSRVDFIHILSIALKEANETGYWLELLNSTGHLDENVFKSVQEDVTFKIINGNNKIK